MRLGQIVLKIRDGDTAFDDRVGGAAELALALENTLQAEMAFVIQLSEGANPNKLDNGISQKVMEKFGVIVALKNDGTQTDKTGIDAYDRLHTVRAEIWKAVLGWKMDDMEDLVSYVGGRVIDINRAYLWYQFEFVVGFRIDNDDGVDMDDLENFDTIYGQWIMTPNANVPVSHYLPVSTDIVHMTSTVDLTEDPDAGGFSSGFSNGFDVYTG